MTSNFLSWIYTWTYLRKLIRKETFPVVENFPIRNSNEYVFIHSDTQARKSLHFEYKHKDVFILISLLQINIVI